VTLVYGLAARLVPRERFDDVASWSQIALALVFVSLALVTPRSAMQTGRIHIEPTAWFLQILPPAWFAGLEALLAVGLPHVGHLAAAAGVALGAIVLLGRSQVLLRISDAIAAVQGERGGRRVRPLPTGLRWPLSGWIATPSSCASFQLATAYLRRDRDVRLRLRPSLVVFAMMPLAGLVLEESRGGHLVPLMSVCLLGMVPGVAVEALRISSHPIASELFAIVPLAGTGPVFHGVRKAAIWYVLPALAFAILASLADRAGRAPARDSRHPGAARLQPHSGRLRQVRAARAAEGARAAGDRERRPARVVDDDAEHPRAGDARRVATERVAGALCRHGRRARRHRSHAARDHRAARFDNPRRVSYLARDERGRSARRVGPRPHPRGALAHAPRRAPAVAG
jgi:hypothetical protein